MLERSWDNRLTGRASPARHVEGRECAGVVPCDTSYEPYDDPRGALKRRAFAAVTAAVAATLAAALHLATLSHVDAAIKENTKVDIGCGLAMREVVLDSDVEVHLVDPDEHGRAPVLLSRNWAAAITEDGVVKLDYGDDDLRLVDSDKWELVKLSSGGSYLLAMDTAGIWPFQRGVERKVKGSSPNRVPEVHWELRIPFDSYGKERGSAGRLAEGDKGARLPA